MSSAQFKVQTEIGDIFLVASDKGLQTLLWEKQDTPLTKDLDQKIPAHKILREAAQQIKDYIAGRRTQFDLPLDITGTPFQQKVWNELRRIPFGQTISYAELAKRIKNPKASRAVGSANGKNSICVVIPCHRVIAADGSLGGFSAGLEVKRRLLAIENIKTK